LPRPNAPPPPSFRAEQADFFPPLCSCKAVGLRREKSLFSSPSSHCYAENLRAPFVILSNGKEHWFWNYERAGQRDAFRIERLPSLADLERLRLKNLQPPRPLLPKK
jgi:hypothetical protein